MARAYTKEEAIQSLKEFYLRHKMPISTNILEKDKNVPSARVYQRLFGSVKNACIEANVPFYISETQAKQINQLNEKLRKEREGQQRINGQNQLMTCISYGAANCVKVQFDDPQRTTTITSWSHFDQGQTENPNFYANRVGEENCNNQGCLMKIVEYIDNEHYIVEFQDKFAYRTKTRYRTFRDGSIRNPFAPTCYSVGIVGVKYSTQDKEAGKSTKEYNTWRKMMERCFDKRRQERDTTYEKVTVCEEWLYYPNFVDWIHQQENFDFWNTNNDAQIDKDLLSESNSKIYSPETCLLVPKCINAIFKKGTGRTEQHKNLPVGVEKYGAKYRARLHEKKLGIYKTPEEAFQAYKTYKETYIKEVAEREYQKGTISKKCYDAMMQYEIEITE